jgi:hypothetical protein
VGVEKLASQKSAEITSRQDALQTICRWRLDIFYPQICAGFLRFGVFQHPLANSLIDVARVGAGSGVIGETACDQQEQALSACFKQDWSAGRPPPSAEIEGRILVWLFPLI